MKDIVFCGDIHGAWDNLFRNIDKLSLEDITLIQVGDVGVGFVKETKQLRQFELINNRFKKRNIQFLAIRGNHDDPRYFNLNVEYSNFELIPDYTFRKINDVDFLFVGGGVSIDRISRTPEYSYWHDEEMVFSPEKIKKCDVLVTHSGPSWNGPSDKKGIKSWCDVDPMLWEDCRRERRIVDDLIKMSKPDKHFCGHFHLSSVVTVDGCTSTILNIEEMKML